MGSSLRDGEAVGGSSFRHCRTVVLAVIRSVLSRAEAGQAICPDEPRVTDAVVAGCHRLSWSRPSLALALGNASKPPGSPLSDLREQSPKALKQGCRCGVGIGSVSQGVCGSDGGGRLDVLSPGG